MPRSRAVGAEGLLDGGGGRISGAIASHGHHPRPQGVSAEGLSRWMGRAAPRPREPVLGLKEIRRLQSSCKTPSARPPPSRRSSFSGGARPSSALYRSPTAELQQGLISPSFQRLCGSPNNWIRAAILSDYSTAVPQHRDAPLDRERSGEKMKFGRHLLILSFRDQKLGRIFLLVLQFTKDR
ncbi:unnamed protein product [Urochloa humidicola]